MLILYLSPEIPGAHRYLKVATYYTNPDHVRCESRTRFETLPLYASCQSVLSTMPWSETLTIFGPPGGQGTQVVLPGTLKSRKSNEDPNTFEQCQAAHVDVVTSKMTITAGFESLA